MKVDITELDADAVGEVEYALTAALGVQEFEIDPEGGRIYLRLVG
jgi:hypothetical protein